MTQPVLDIFSLPVFQPAENFPMISADLLQEMAEDIQENGLNEPLVVAKVGDEWMLIDGRNRREACKLAGIVPTYRVVEGDNDKLKALVWSYNGPRRNLTSSQKAMAYAMMYPETKRGMGAVSLLPIGNNEGMSKGVISRARFILKNDPDKAALVRDGHPDYPLSRTYDEVKSALEERARRAEEERKKLEQLSTLRNAYPDLAVLVDEGRMYLDEALDLAEHRVKKAKEDAERLRAEEEAKLEEAEQLRLEEARKAQEYYEQCRVAFFHQLDNLISGSSVVGNDAQVTQAMQYTGEWDKFSQKYRHNRQEVLNTLQILHKNLPSLITAVEKM